jgi:hypothetical protein
VKRPKGQRKEKAESRKPKAVIFNKKPNKNAQHFFGHHSKITNN